MIASLFKKLKKPQVEATAPSIPPNRRIYCIGDIHGRADLLQQLHQQIQTDASDYKHDKTIIYLGDYIDRGEQSKEVIDILLSNPLPDFEPIFLQGNHEEIILGFIAYPVAAASWLSFGGREALNSYGIPLAHVPNQQEIIQLSKQLDNKLPDSHRDFFENCKDSHQCGNYYFVHAGILPGVALNEQILEDKLWIRGEFLESKKDHGAIIVHGHSISFEPQFLPNRIGIDTGAYNTGVLTCLVLEGEEQRLLQTGRGT